jgi:hypothetical protein
MKTVRNTNWFAGCVLGYVLLFLNCIGLLTNGYMNFGLEVVSSALVFPGLVLLAYYGVVGFNKLEKITGEYDRLKEENRQLHQWIAENIPAKL